MRHQTGRNSADRHGVSLGRTAVENVDDSKLMQETHHSMFQDEQQQQIEHVHPYGFVNYPKKPTGQGKLRRAAEAFMSYLGAGRSHGVALVVGDRRYRLYKLAEGEVALHDDQGQQVHIKRDGIWLSVPHTKQVKMQIMDDDKMPQDSGGSSSSSSSSGNSAQQMGQIQQAGRAAKINVSYDNQQFTINHPDGTVNSNSTHVNITTTA